MGSPPIAAFDVRIIRVIRKVCSGNDDSFSFDVHVRITHVIQSVCFQVVKGAQQALGPR